MKRTFLSIMLLAASLPAFGATVKIGHYVANPGAWFTVPVEIDSVKGLASAVVRVTYNPEVLELKAVRQGDLKQVFDFDFTVEMLPSGVEIISVSRFDIEQELGGTLAELRFAVREGSGGLYSDLALGDVHLDEQTMTLDLSAKDPLKVVPGISRSLSTEGNCTSRMEGQPFTVVAGSVLNDLTLAEGDTLGVSDDHEPIVVNGTLKAPATIPLETPDHGWIVGTYKLLKTSTPNLTLVPIEPPENYAISTTTIGGITAYIMTVDAVAGVDVETDKNVALTETDKNRIRSLFEGIGGSGKDAKPIHIKGTTENIQLGLDLGMMPEYGITQSRTASLGGEKILATFGEEPPLLKIISFKLNSQPDENGNQTGAVRVKIIPREKGVRFVSNDIAEGTFTVMGSDTLSLPMEPIPITSQDVGDYLNTTTKGEVLITLQLGKNRFVRVRAGRP